MGMPLLNKEPPLTAKIRELVEAYARKNDITDESLTMLSLAVRGLDFCESVKDTLEDLENFTNENGIVDPPHKKRKVAPNHPATSSPLDLLLDQIHETVVVYAHEENLIHDDLCKVPQMLSDAIPTMPLQASMDEPSLSVKARRVVEANLRENDLTDENLKVLSCAVLEPGMPAAVRRIFASPMDLRAAKILDAVNPENGFEDEDLLMVGRIVLERGAPLTKRRLVPEHLASPLDMLIAKIWDIRKDSSREWNISHRDLIVTSHMILGMSEKTAISIT
jgi:hypothetical protein